MATVGVNGLNRRSAVMGLILIQLVSKSKQRRQNDKMSGFNE